MRYYFETDHYKEFLSGSVALCPESHDIEDLVTSEGSVTSLKFRLFKTVFDYGCASVALPVVGFIACILFLINPFLNPGPVFFSQTRAGRSGKPFRMWKFRSMSVASDEARAPNAPLEEARIAPIGRFMRTARIDELPNFINVIRGEMSVIGPRPEALSHSEHYSVYVPGYAARMRVKPGITGLAQVEQGYVEDEDATALKAKYDNMYVKRLCGRLDLYIIVKTFAVMLKGIGAR